MEALKHSKYTYADYLTWDDEDRCEIIAGEFYSMSPAPIRKHQRIVSTLSGEIYGYLKGKPCEVYIAPFDVRLSEDTSDDHVIENVVQPDLSVFCDENKLDDRGAVGAPDLVIEVLSPSTKDKDMNTKLLLYQRFGVTEYWIIDLDKKVVLTYTIDDFGRYPEAISLTNPSDLLTSKVLESFEIKLSEIFR